MAAIAVKREGTGDNITFDTVAEVGSAAEFTSSIEKVWGEGALLKPSSTSAFTARTPKPFPHGIYTFRPKSGTAAGQRAFSVHAVSPAEGGSDGALSKVLTTLVELKALLPALMMMSNPFQSASSVTSKQAEAQASDFKARLLHYYFSIPAPPGLQLPQPQAHQTWQCMVSWLRLKSNLIKAAHLVPKASAQARTLPALTSKQCKFTHLSMCSGALGITDVWDEQNGLLWAEPFEKAYHAYEIVVMYQPSTGTFRFRVLTESLMCKRLSEYGKSSQARDCPDSQKHTFGECDDTDLLMPSGNMPFRCSLAIHAAMAVAAQQLHMRSSLSFRAEDFDIVTDYAEKGTTAAWVQLSLATAVGSE